jgi:hypothetical protein
MKALITLALIVGLYLLGKAMFEGYQAQERRKNPQQQNTGAGPAASVLEGLPPQFEESLAAAQAQGAPALKAWLGKYGQFARDPRLADIQLDYVVLVSRTNPAEAKQFFRAVQSRTPKTSRVYERVKRLEPTFGN